MHFAMAMLSMGLVTAWFRGEKPVTDRDLIAAALCIAIAIADHSRKSQKAP